MERTISVMLGKGSVRHNTREFKAANVNIELTHNNIEYYNTPIREVYRELFNGAVERYNAKQTRTDRCISDYYEKIRTGKQEKLFKEVIFQVGKKENMSSISEDGQLAAKVLDEFMRNFQERNPNLRVFSAHLHMDEATPHLHVDFVPYITGSKRGLDTRVSLKQALAAQGFTGGTRGDTEWNQWVRSEKECLSQVMERHGIEWEQLGTHETHLSVENYKKEQRVKEVAALETTAVKKQEEISVLVEKKASAQNDLDAVDAKVEVAQNKLESVRETLHFIADNARHYDDDPELKLPAPRPLMSAKMYHESTAIPLFRKLKDVIRSILLEYFEMKRDLQSRLSRANDQIRAYYRRNNELEPENERLRGVERDYSRVRRVLGGERVDEIVNTVKEQEAAKSMHERTARRSWQKRDYVR